MRRFILPVLLPVVLVLLSSDPATWGFYAHGRINRLAVFTLPPPVYEFFRSEIDYLSEHAADPDKRRYAVKGEAECHFIDIDHYTRNKDSILYVIPAGWDSAVSLYSEDTLRKHGIAPWNLLWTLRKLTKAFEEKNREKILRHSADLGHYTGDIHVPLHTTKNYNGQLTDQHGIHGLWETRLPELFAGNYRFFLDKAGYLDDPAGAIWKAAIDSHLALDSVLEFEKRLSAEFGNKYTYEERSGNTMKNYDRTFAREYHEMLGGMVERRMKAAIKLLGDLWFTAWVNAGQPDLSTITSVKLGVDPGNYELPGDSVLELREHE